MTPKAPAPHAAHLKAESEYAIDLRRNADNREKDFCKVAEFPAATDKFECAFSTITRRTTRDYVAAIINSCHQTSPFRSSGSTQAKQPDPFESGCSNSHVVSA